MRASSRRRAPVGVIEPHAVPHSPNSADCAPDEDEGESNARRGPSRAPEPVARTRRAGRSVLTAYRFKDAGEPRAAAAAVGERDAIDEARRWRRSRSSAAGSSSRERLRSRCSPRSAAAQLLSVGHAATSLGRSTRSAPTRPDGLDEADWRARRLGVVLGVGSAAARPWEAGVGLGQVVCVVS